MTKEQLQAANAALRELLAAASAYADTPHAADHADAAYVIECERRLDVIAIYANGEWDGMDPAVYLLVIGDRAKELRERAAMPVRYQVRAKAAHPFDAGEGSRELAGPGRELLATAIAEEEDATRDQPASPDAAGVLAAAIAAGTPVVVTE